MGARWLRGSRWAVPALAVAIGVAVPAATSPSVQAGVGDTVVVTFEYTGAAQTWVVPATVSVATFDVYGAQGGSGNVETGAPQLGGLGGRATATVSVTPGSTIDVFVGGKGADFVNQSPDCNIAGGFNGGGDAGAQTVGEGFCGQGGGGASDVRIGGDALSDRALVAGGGGGASANLFCPAVGSGGGLSGGSVPREGLCTGGGAGGNQDGTSGSGVLGSGSDGGPFENGLAPGGGGGGGYYGGAGGETNGYGGGGGSGFGPSDTDFETGVRAGNGLVTITYGTLAIAELDPPSGTAGTPVTITGSGFNPTPGATTVQFGPYGATDVSCASSTSCTAVAPPNTAGGSEVVDLTVSTGGMTSNSLTFTYLAIPTLTAISPTSGPEAGGTPITFRGTNFSTEQGVTGFIFGSLDAGSFATSVNCPSTTECTGLTPPGTGAVSVFASTIEGTSEGLPFTYVSDEEAPIADTGAGDSVTLVVLAFGLVGAGSALLVVSQRRRAAS